LVFGGGPGKLVLIGEIDLVLIGLCFGCFDGGAEGREKHIAGYLRFPCFRLVKIDYKLLQFGVTEATGPADKNPDHFVIGIVEQLFCEFFPDQPGCSNDKRCLSHGCCIFNVKVRKKWQRKKTNPRIE
jgi:hypothetical protein